MRLTIGGHELPGWLVGTAAVGVVLLYGAIGLAVIASIYARDTILATIGRPATVVLVVAYLLPLVLAWWFADRLRARLQG